MERKLSDTEWALRILFRNPGYLFALVNDIYSMTMAIFTKTSKFWWNLKKSWEQDCTMTFHPVATSDMRSKLVAADFEIDERIQWRSPSHINFTAAKWIGFCQCRAQFTRATPGRRFGPHWDQGVHSGGWGQVTLEAPIIPTPQETGTTYSRKEVKPFW